MDRTKTAKQLISLAEKLAAPSAANKAAQKLQAQAFKELQTAYAACRKAGNTLKDARTTRDRADGLDRELTMKIVDLAIEIRKYVESI